MAYEKGMNGIWLRFQEKDIPDYMWYPIENLEDYPEETRIAFEVNDLPYQATITGRKRDRNLRGQREYGYIWEAKRSA